MTANRRGHVLSSHRIDFKTERSVAVNVFFIPFTIILQTSAISG